MNNKYRAIIMLSFALSAAVSCSRSATESHELHDSHLTTVNEQGDQAMVFSHEKTTHHFRLFADGGAIEVTADSPQDAESRELIRKHLSHIPQMFAAGNFDAPMLTHGKVPPGVPALQKLKSEISYQFEEFENGGRVRIKTGSPEALAAIHEFLRFQISDHLTGDSPGIVSE